MPGLSTVPVAGNEEVGPGAFLLRAEGDFPAAPGQFYFLRAWQRDPLLSRPMSVFDREDGQISFLIFVRGRGTQSLAGLRPGDPLTLFGPLGTPLNRHAGRIALVGGGSGIAPLYLAAKEFRATGEVDLFLGFRHRPLLVPLFEGVASRVHVASEAGIGGRAGMVTEIFHPRGYDACYACGPDGMLKGVWEACRSAGVPLWVLLEERMACGVGACRGCAVHTVGGFRLACRDGPAFPAEEVFVDP